MIKTRKKKREKNKNKKKMEYFQSIRIDSNI